MPTETEAARNQDPSREFEDRIERIISEKAAEVASEPDGLRRVVEENLKLKSDLVRMRDALARAYDLIEKVTGNPEFTQFMQPSQEQDK